MLGMTELSEIRRPCVRRPPGRRGPLPIEYGAAARAAGLIAVAEDLAGEFSLRPLLERILLRCTELLGCTAGSICSVDEAAGTYRKEADIGVACQSGQVFPLTEGMTGTVVARRAPVWFDRYDQVRGGHVAAADRATLRGVIGVPLEWRGRIIGACVVFSRRGCDTPARTAEGNVLFPLSRDFGLLDYRQDADFQHGEGQVGVQQAAQRGLELVQVTARPGAVPRSSPGPGAAPPAGRAVRAEVLVGDVRVSQGAADLLGRAAGLAS